MQIIIRKLTFEDLPTRVAWMNNPAIYCSMHFSVPVLLDKTIKWYDNNLTRTDRADMAFCDEGEGVVAFGGITSIDKEVGKGETYIFTAPEAHHLGIGTKAIKLLCKYGFEEMGLNKLYAYINEDNEASIRLHKKVGYEIEGCLRQEYRDVNGQLKDRLYLGFLRKNWCW